MRKTVIALMMALPMLAACPSGNPAANPSGTPSANPNAGSTTPVATPSGAPGAGAVTNGPAQADAKVIYKDFNFTPNSVTIKAGQSVAFENPADAFGKLRVIADDGTWDSNFIDPGMSYVQKFDKAGTFTYKHQTQTSARGTVVVQ